MTAESLPAVSVLVVTKGNHPGVERAVASLTAGDYPEQQVEIVVVEETGSPQAVTGERVRYVPVPETDRGYGYARNQALVHATADIVAFTDDDCVVDAAWLRHLVRPLLEDDRIMAVGGCVRVPPCGPVGQCESILGFPGGGVKYLHASVGAVITRNTFSTCNCAIRTEALAKVGGFNDALRYGGEDEALSREIAARWRVVYAPDAVVYHEPRDSLSRVFRWFIRRGIAQARMRTFTPHPGRARIRAVTNSPLVRLALLAGVAVILRIPLLPLLAGAGAVWYAVVLARFRWARKYYPSQKTYLLIPVVKAVMDVGMDIGRLASPYIGRGTP
ncbi:MAG: glycosyltransferase [Chitinivibrionales bacterium]|nr:glycosyltransferase [Chitinivibrionales bacterium]